MDEIKNMEFGLIGEKLGHSYSKLIQEQLLDSYVYELHPLAKCDLDAFMKQKAFKGINVTIPYKEAVIPYLDEIDEHARTIGAVNTIVNHNQKLIGYNSDYYGFDYTLKHHHIDVEAKKVLVAGNGGASKAIKAVLKDHHAKTIITTSRTLKENVLSLDEVYKKHNDIQIIVNTTPVGMYPHVFESYIDISHFPNLTACVDIIYNPQCTQFILDAKKQNIKAVNGLEMLVGQAKRALELFKDIHIDDTQIDKVYKNILKETLNIALHNINQEELNKLSKQTNKQIVVCRNEKELLHASIQNNQLLHILFPMHQQIQYELQRNSYYSMKQTAQEVIQDFENYINTY